MLPDFLTEVYIAFINNACNSVFGKDEAVGFNNWRQKGKVMV